MQELVDSPDLLYLLRAVVGRFRDIEKIHSFCIQQHDWVGFRLILSVYTTFPSFAGRMLCHKAKLTTYYVVYMCIFRACDTPLSQH